MGDSPSSDHDHLSHGHHHIIPDFIRHDEADLAIDGVREEHATRGRSPMAAASPAASTPMVAKTDSENVSPARPRSPSPSETVVEGVQFAEPSKPRTGAGLPGRAETMTTGSDNKSALNGLVGSRRGRDQHLVEFEYGDKSDPRRFPSWWKWTIVMMAFVLEMWANVISSIYAPGVQGVAKEFGISAVAGRVPQAVYLLGFALGPVVLAPLSEDYGRWPTMVGSCLILGLTQIACALAPNLTVLIIFRFIGGYFASATFNAIGFVSDMWNAEEQGWVVNAYALFAEVGAVLGPIVGGYIFERHGWRWIFGVSGIVLAGLLVTFAVFAPETRAGVILTRRAKQLRKKTGDTRYYAMHEKVRSEHTPSALAREMLVRPLFMLFTEPIVASFGLFDGVNYAIIYMFLECFPLVYAQYGFTVSQQGLPFIGVMVGFFIAFGSYAIQDALHRRAAHKSKTGEAPPEARLLWGMPGGLLFPISLFWFAWTSFPPVPWIVSVIAGGLFGISSHIIFIVVADYTVASYTIYATSAVAAQSLLRELLSGALSLVTEQMYEGLGYQWASTLLAFLGVGLAPIPFVLYYFGPAIRKRSSFYEEVQAAEREARHREAELEEEFSRENTIATRATAGWNRTMTTNGTRTRGAYAGRGGAIEGDEEKQERPHQQENHVPLDDVPEETAMSPAQKLQEAEAHGKYEEEREKAAQDKNNSGAGRD